MAQRAQQETRKHFGNSIYMFTPLYIANYCENYCIYCGFNCHNKIRRAKLNFEQIEQEMQAIAATGLEEILLLTGESRKMSDVEYIGEACKIAKKYFKLIGLEIYPVNSDEYAYLHQCGADFVTVFQETYDSGTNTRRCIWADTSGVFPYRVSAQERAAHRRGMRGARVLRVPFWGLADFRKDAFRHRRRTPGCCSGNIPTREIAFSCPRPQTDHQSTTGNQSRWMCTSPSCSQVVMCVPRSSCPFASITDFHQRVCQRLSDHVTGIAATKISAGVSTGIGSHVEEIEDKGDEQFVISDGRSVDEVYQAIKDRGLQPVMNDYVYV